MAQILKKLLPSASMGVGFTVASDLRRSWIAVVLLVIAAASALPSRLMAEARGAADPPDLILEIEIDPASGAFTASSVLRAPQGEVRLPDAEWLEIDTVRVEGADRSIEPGDARVLSDADHGNRDLRLTVSGRLPAPAAPMGAAASTSEATYLLGPLWFPMDETAVRDIDIHVSAPPGQRIAATGNLLSETRSARGEEARFAFRGFVRDFSLFIGPYAVNEEIRDGLRLRTYFETGDPDLSQRYLDAVAGYIARYEATVGDYPHDGFSVVSTPMPVGLGFAGLTYVSRDILGHPYMTGRSLAHEVLHSWWGNAVGIDYASGNWAEGLTTFQADYALAEDAGPEAARTMRIGWIRDLARLGADEAQPLTAFRSSVEARDQSEGYGKAAFVFHMLRAELGPETFAAGIRSFYAAQRDRIAGWRDIRTAFETAARRDLGWFFGQWTERAGLPQVTLSVEGAAALAEGGYEVTLAFRQTVPAYRLHMPLRIETAAGPERHVVAIDGLETRATLRLDAPPLSVVPDPGFDIARRPAEGELTPILQDMREAESFVAIAASPGAGTETVMAEALAPLTGGAEISWQQDLGAEDGRAVVIAGHLRDVADRRPEHLGGMPDIPREGATRLWVERDRSGRLWVFLTFEDADDLAADLRSAGFYSGQSHLTAEDGGVTGVGIWPDMPARTTLAINVAARDGLRP